ncbi:LysR substrate-binding domain-containing protein [Mameliella sediminis]|uniref:LysR substrate-binding domain-containing protein n=1 Tax=Mameliella sediminis TaxID=2836866 RepID=UPI001C4937F9|nr:LysR substrate-binding domain-containing protein [Mameliella sediminis]MBY6114290.1 LysR family transcriptional regulator [Antarctobacter heliothermus]MBY6143863.1 LysR family transcriptional regulator [Mameliella alba]MBV7393229.1 LysR family transcriptional regulator [Mameliella sediminis]MBY6163299.1 LysR family transcriptional regulator [Mameliella alba]MBY6171562.1 LysR family transcriptional regulator [Mameliella alba]
MQRLPNLNALRVLAEVAESGSFTTAAERLGVTQSAVSKQIAALEAELGQPLFLRHHRRVEITAFGSEVANVARAAFDRMADGLVAVSRDRPRQIRLVGDADFLLLWLNPRLARFESAHPDIRLNLVAQVGMNLPQDGDYDIALIWGEGLWPGCRFEPILRNHVFPVAAPDYAERTGRQDMPDLSDLRESELIHDQTRFWWSAVMRSVGGQAPGADAGRLYNLSALCLEAAACSDGVTIGDEVSTRGYLESGRLCCPWPVRLPSHHAYYLVRPSDTRDSDEVTAFRHWLLQEARDHGDWFTNYWAKAERTGS